MVVKRRNESIEKKTAQEANLVERRRDRCFQEERRLLRSQMALDAARHQKMNDIKDEEKEKAEKDVYDTLAKLEQQQHRDMRLTSSVSSSAQKNDHDNTVDTKIGEASRTEVVQMKGSISKSSDKIVEIVTGKEHQQQYLKVQLTI